MSVMSVGENKGVIQMGGLSLDFSSTKKRRLARAEISS